MTYKHFIILFLFILISSCFANSRTERKRINKEHAVINEAIVNYNRDSINYIYSNRKELICVTFLNIFTINENDSPLFLNMQRMGGSCDWALVFYSGTVHEIENSCYEANKYFYASNKNLSQIIHCARNLESMQTHTIYDEYVGIHVNLSVPKTVMYHDVIPYLNNYKRIFLMDEDISLKGFQIDKLLKTWRCGFQPNPLIVQPLIEESNQYLVYVNKNSWAKYPRNKVIASSTGIYNNLSYTD